MKKLVGSFLLRARLWRAGQASRESVHRRRRGCAAPAGHRCLPSCGAEGQQSHPAAPAQPGGTGHQGSTGKMQSLVPVLLPHAQDVRCPCYRCTVRSDRKGRSKARCKLYYGRNMTISKWNGSPLNSLIIRFGNLVSPWNEHLCFGS